jgi:hypothetical protein
MKKTVTPFDGIETRKAKRYQPATPEEDATVLALTAAGATGTQIGTKLGRSHQWVSYRKKKMATEIAEYRKDVMEDLAEDYTDTISLTMYRMRQQLMDDGIAAKIPIRDLAQVLKTVFNARQIMLKEPTEIPGVPSADLGEKSDIDRKALADEFNRNFEKLQRAAIEAMSVDAEVGDFVECPD